MKFSRDSSLLMNLQSRNTMVFTYASKPFPFYKTGSPQVFVSKKEISIKRILKSFDTFFPSKYSKVCVYMPGMNPWLHPIFLRALEKRFEEVLIIY